MSKSNGRAVAVVSRTRCNFEPLERRQMLSAAISDLAAQFVPESTFLYKTGTYLTKATPGQPLDIALNYFRANANAFNITAADVGNPVVTNQYTDTDSGMTHVYLRQQVNGLEIANANANFNIRSDGRILSVGSTFVSGAAELAGQALAPQLDVASAAKRAGANLSLRTTRAPQVLAAPVGTARIAKLRSTDLSSDDIPARLKYVAAPDGVQLAWNFVLHDPSGAHWYDTSINANSGAQLFTGDWVDSDALADAPAPAKSSSSGAKTSAKPQAGVGSNDGSLSTTSAAGYNASYDVYAYPKRNPDSGGRTIETNPWDAIASQFGWQDTNGNSAAESNTTVGNNVSAQDDTDNNDTGGNHPATNTGTFSGTGTFGWDYPINLTQAPSTYQNAAIVNLYYWNNILHDIQYRYGFNEPAGNFQQVNYTGTGAANDRVQADAQDGSGSNNANFSTPPDGQSGRMQMYLWNYASPSRDSSLDAEIMIHEYGHGVSTRLTGGPANSNSLNTVQSGGMGEGWGDWWGLMLLQTDGSAATLNGARPVANYSIGEDANGPSIRRYPYSFNKSIDPMTFGLFNSSTEVHHTGELWATTLWDMAVLLEKKWGFNANIKNGYTTSSGSGNILALKLVMDALKLQPANPSFLQARDAILQADTNLTGGANQREIWQAFARRGLGTSATTASTNATTINEAFDVPAAISAPLVAHSTPLSPLQLQGSVSSVTFRFSEAMNPASFNVATDVFAFTGPGGTDLKSTIGAPAWSNANKTLTIPFTAVSTDGTYSMTIGPNITAADNGQQMDQNLNNVPGEAGDVFTNSFVFDAKPGPDAVGYEASPVAFQNISLASSGGTTLLDNQDDTNAAIGLGGGSFNFYGTNYTSVFVNDNGLITFGSGSNAFANNNMTFSLTLPAIAALWDDWATDTGGADKVLYQLAGNQLTIEWSAVASRGDGAAGVNSTAATFQAILSLNTGTTPGDIVLNYVDLNVTNGAQSGYTNGGSATVGIKDAGLQGANGNNRRNLVSLFNTPNLWLGDGKAIKFSTSSSVPVTATVAGTTFEDRDGDGVLSGESGIGSVTVFADANNNGSLDGGEVSTTSDPAGVYSLANVPSGAITIRELPPTNYIVTNPTAGNLTLTPGETRTGVNFGNFLTSYSGNQMTLRLDPTGTKVQVWIDQPVAGTPTWSAAKTLITTLAFTGNGASNVLTLDLANGNPLPGGGVSYNGGGSTDDAISVKGATTADTVTFNASNVTIGGIAANFTNTEASVFDGRGGNDTLNVNAGATVSILTTQHLAALNIAAGGTTRMVATTNTVLVTNALSNAGLLDLNDNDAIVFYSGASVLGSVQGQINTARNGGTWNGATGITSTTAHNVGPFNRTLGAMESADFKSVYGPSATFDGEALPGTAVIIKYTYYGDTDFNGVVNFDDYSRTDAGFNSGRSGWLNGDFDGNGVVNFDDYSLIDLAFNTQGVPL